MISLRYTIKYKRHPTVCSIIGFIIWDKMWHMLRSKVERLSGDRSLKIKKYVKHATGTQRIEES